jgi:hypothetical protein
MKNLRLVLPLTLVAFVATFSLAAADSYDSETATVQKATDKTAKVTVGKDTYKTPITFDDGADWSAVKDHYEISDEAASEIKSDKACLSIGSDGTLSIKKMTKK